MKVYRFSEKQRINLEISANDKGAHSNEENQNSRCGTKVYKVNYFRKNAVLNTKDAVDIVQNYLGERDREHLSIICLNTRCEPTHLQIVAIGDHTIVPSIHVN